MFQIRLYPDKTYSKEESYTWLQFKNQNYLHRTNTFYEYSLLRHFCHTSLRDMTETLRRHLNFIKFIFLKFFILSEIYPFFFIINIGNRSVVVSRVSNSIYGKYNLILYKRVLLSINFWVLEKVISFKYVGLFLWV